MNLSCTICNERLQDIFNRNKDIMSGPLSNSYRVALYNIETAEINDIDSWLICIECIIHEKLLLKYNYRYATDKEIERYELLSKLL